MEPYWERVLRIATALITLAMGTCMVVATISGSGRVFVVALILALVAFSTFVLYLLTVERRYNGT